MREGSIQSAIVAMRRITRLMPGKIIVKYEAT